MSLRFKIQTVALSCLSESRRKSGNCGMIDWGGVASLCSPALAPSSSSLLVPSRPLSPLSAGSLALSSRPLSWLSSLLQKEGAVLRAGVTHASLSTTFVLIGSAWTREANQRASGAILANQMCCPSRRSEVFCVLCWRCDGVGGFVCLRFGALIAREGLSKLRGWWCCCFVVGLSLRTPLGSLCT